MIFKLQNIKKILIRTNGGAGIGFGHFKRCSGLVSKLRKSYPDAEFVWLLNQELSDLESKPTGRIIYSKDNDFGQDDITLISQFKPDMVIVDSYLPDKEYLIRLHDIALLVFFDDNNRFEFVPADFVINGNIYAERLPYKPLYDNTIFLLGMKYLFLSEEYELIPEITPKPQSVLVTIGGSDSENFMPELIKLTSSIPNHSFTYVIGRFFPDHEYEKYNLENDLCYFVYSPDSLRNLILEHEICLCTSSTTAYEVLRCQRKLICFQTAENQIEIGREIANQGLGVNIGWYKSIKRNLLEGKLNG